MEQVCYCVNSVLDCCPDGQNRLLVFVSTPDENVVSWTLCVCVCLCVFLFIVPILCRRPET